MKTTVAICRTFLLISLLAAGVLAQGAQSVEAQNYRAPGELIDVGGYRLHLNCTGKGSPTVLLEGGAGDFSLDWSLVQPKVAANTRVCSYDRAGYGWSDAGPLPRTMRQIVRELHTALKKARVKGPYVFVGQSYGGLLARVFASQYPKEIAGVVLVDSTHEDTEIMMNNKVTLLRELSRNRELPAVKTKMPPSTAPRTTAEKQNKSSSPVTIGAPYNQLPPEVQQMRRWLMAQPKYDEARESEFDFLGEELGVMHEERAKNKIPLSDLPLIVLARGKNQREANKKLQADLVRLSRNSKQVIAENSGHHIHIDDPELVAKAILEVVNAIRQKTKLV